MNSNSIGRNPNIRTRVDIPPTPVRDKKTNAWNEIQIIAFQIFNFLENVFYTYAREANNIAKRTIKVITVACSDLHAKLSPVIAKMGILSAISCLLSLKAIPSHVQSLIEHIKLNDGEGMAFSIMSLIVEPLDALDALITTMGSLVAFGVIPTIAFFGLIGLPLAIGLVGYAAFKGLYNVIRCGINLNALPKSLRKGNLENFKNYIEEKIGITAKERERIETKYRTNSGELNDTAVEKKIKREFKIIKDRKRNILKRHSDAKVYNIMKNLQKHLNSETANLDTANKALRDMKKIMGRKITSGSIGVASNIAFAVTLACSMIFPISALAIPVVAGLRAGVAFGRHHYEHVWLDKGLELPKG